MGYWFRFGFHWLSPGIEIIEIIYSADDITSFQDDHEPQGTCCFMM